MTPQQRKKYRAEFGKLAAIWKERGYTEDQIEEERQTILVLATGGDFSERVSSSDLTPEQLDKVFAHLAEQLRDTLPLEDATTAFKRRQYIYMILREQPSPTWAASVSQDLWRTRDWRNLPIKPQTAPNGFESAPPSAWPCLLRLRRRVANEYKRHSAPV